MWKAAFRSAAHFPCASSPAAMLDADVRSYTPRHWFDFASRIPASRPGIVFHRRGSTGVYHAFTMRQCCSMALLIALGLALAVSAQTDTQTEFRQIAEL